MTCCQRPLHHCTGRCEKLLMRSYSEIRSVSLHDLVQVLVRRSCGDPVEMPKTSLQQDLEDPPRWCFYESFSGMFIIIPQ